MNNLATSISPVYESALESFSTTIKSINWQTTEHKGLAYVVIRGQQTDKIFIQAMKKLGLTLPKPLRITTNTNKTLIWISPDEFLLIMEDAKKLEFLAQAQQLFANTFAVALDNSGSLVNLEISGTRYLDVLSKLSPYEFTKLESGTVISSYLGTAPVICYRQQANALTILVRFSFADYLWQLLENSSMEYR